MTSVLITASTCLLLPSLVHSRGQIPGQLKEVDDDNNIIGDDLFDFSSPGQGSAFSQSSGNSVDIGKAFKQMFCLIFVMVVFAGILVGGYYLYKKWAANREQSGSRQELVNINQKKSE